MPLHSKPLAPAWLAAMLVLLLLLAACAGDDSPASASSDAPELLARIGPDSRSEPFDAPGAWHVAATAAGYCAIVVFTEPDGTRLTADWDVTGFVLPVDEGGRYSISASGCVKAEALRD